MSVLTRCFVLAAILCTPCVCRYAAAVVPDTLGQDCCVASDTLVLPTAIVSERVGQNWRAAAATYSLDRKGLDDRGATTLSDALRRLPATTVRDYGGAGGLKTVSIRGMGAQHTTITHDGIPVGDAFGGAIDLRRLDLDRATGITLALGDTPTLLVAPRALGTATLDIRTAGCDESRPWQVGLRHGSFGTLGGTLDAGGTIDKRSAWHAYSTAMTAHNDYPYDIPNGSETMHLRRQHSAMRTATAGIGIDRDTSTPDGGGKLALRTEYQGDWRQLPGQIVLYHPDNAEYMATHHATMQAAWHQRYGAWRLMAGAKGAMDVTHYTDLGGKYPGGRLHHHYRLDQGYCTLGAQRDAGCLSIAYAADAGLDAMHANLETADGITRRSLVQALSLRYAPWQQMSLTARLTGHTYWEGRGQTHRYWGQLTPTLNAVVGLLPQDCRTALSLRASYVEGFRLPTFGEQYQYHLGSQNLRPEYVRQGGAGLALWHKGGTQTVGVESLALSADAYMGRMSDRIVSIPYTLNIWRTQNMGQTRHHGLDVAGEVSLRLATTHRLVVTATYSWQRAVDKTDHSSASYDKQIAYLPLHSASLAVAWHNPWVDVVASVTAASRRWATNEHVATTDLPPYAEANLRLSRSLVILHRTTTLSLDVLNILDHRYEVIRRYPMPGRSLMVTLKVKK